MKHLLLLVFLSLVLVGCAGTDATTPHFADGTFFTSYKDIPGVTDAEIQAIEALREQGVRLIYGGLPSTESFTGEDGEIKGFMVLFSEFLSSLFDIDFQPALYEWDDLIAGLESGEIAFTGELTATEERRERYFMTDPIALRTVKIFRLAGSRPLMEIAIDRPLRYAFLDGVITGDDVKAASADSIEVFFVDNYEIAYEMLENRTIDAFFEESPAEYVFDEYPDIVTRFFFPLLFADVSLTTQIPALEPIISVVQKMLENGGGMYLAQLYNKGRHIYMQNKFLRLLSEEEREYVRNRAVIPFLAEYTNYPVSFYNTRDGEWQGVIFDVIEEVESISGLSFQVVNDHNTGWEELLGMLESGEGSVISQLVRTRERENNFHWPTTTISYDYYALLSRSDFRNISYNEIFHLSVGAVRNSAHSELFKNWFPNHLNLVEYPCVNTLFEALEQGKIDLAMSSQDRLLYLTNFREHAWYKINFRFDLPFGSTLGFHRGDSLLCNIVDKALDLINTQDIHDMWARKVFDYRIKLAEERLPLVFGLSGLLLCVLALVFILMLRSRNEGKRLEQEVQTRTLELKNSHIKLEEAMQASESANRAKSDFLAVMSHEIRTPMNAILGITQIQLQKQDLAGDYEEAFDKIYRSGRSLLEIINDILDLSKIETGKLELNPIEYDLPSLINDAVQINIVKVSSKGLCFKIDPNPDLPSKLYGDELRLRQILNNLLSNAIKYTNKGHVKMSVNHSIVNEDILLRFSIEDTGQGLTPDDKAKLFSEYQRFNATANRNTEGTGLGLSITKRLIEMMGGKIEVESVHGKGSTFTVEIIQKGVKCEPIGVNISENLKKFTFSTGKRERLHKTCSIMPYGRVLIVDDVDTNLYVAEGLLAPYQLHTETVSSGFAAINKIEKGNVYDIIFMDHMMPEMDGMETTQKLRALGYKGTIIALTANAIAGNADIFKQNEFDGFVSKPIDIRYMDAVLNEFIRDKHPEEAKKYSTVNVRADGNNPLLLEIFRQDAKKAITAFEETIQSNNIKLFTITAHAMKSALANVGESKVSNMAAALEKAGMDGDKDYISANIDRFIQNLEELIENISNNKETGGDNADISEDTAYLAEQLEIIKTACEDFDNTAVYQALDRLKEKTWKNETVTALESIREFIYVSSDFEAAAELAQTLIEPASSSAT